MTPKPISLSDLNLKTKNTFTTSKNTANEMNSGLEDASYVNLFHHISIEKRIYTSRSGLTVERHMLV